MHGHRVLGVTADEPQLRGAHLRSGGLGPEPEMPPPVADRFTDQGDLISGVRPPPAAVGPGEGDLEEAAGHHPDRHPVVDGPDHCSLEEFP